MTVNLTKSIVTAADVRAFLAAEPKRLERLSPEARKTVEPGARGRLHPQAIKVYNKGRKPERQYVLGAGKAQREAARALRAQAVEAGAGARGPLPKAVKESLGLTKA